MAYRVEALAQVSGVSVDTIRFYQSRRLLHPPRREGRVALYDSSHVERLARIRELQADGYSLGLIGRLVRGEIGEADQALVGEVVGPGVAERDTFLGVEDLARRAGVPVALLEALERDGVLVARRHRGEPCYTEADLDALRAGLVLLENGLPAADVLQLAKRYGDVTRGVADEAVELFDRHVRQVLRSSGVEDEARLLVEAFRALLPATVTLVAHHFRRTLLAAAQEHIEEVGDADELAAVADEAVRILDTPILDTPSPARG